MSEDESLNIDNFSTLCRLRREIIIAFVEHGVLNPAGNTLQEWQFSAIDLKRSQKALRLHEDLEINLPGVALALNLLEEIEHLRQALQCWEK